MRKKIVEVQSISKNYGGADNITKALENVSFSVQEGEFIGVMGPSGSGKTTLLNCIATIDKATSGEIIINEKKLNRLEKKELTLFRRAELGFIFQDFNLLDTLNAYENISLALSIQNVKYTDIHYKIEQLSETLGITGILDKYPYQLSGGEKQRTACARALINDPSLLLADEPTGALDSNASRNLLEMFQTINQRLQTTIILVTHDAYSASYCGRVVFMKDGRVFREISKEDDQQNRFYDSITSVMKDIGEPNENEY